MAAWPANLPVPLFDGIEITPGRRARRFEVDDGPAKQSATTTAALDRVKLVYRCTVAQEPLIRNFYKGAGAGGGAWFTFVQPFTGATINARFIVGNEPTSVAVRPKFDVTVTLEVDAW